MPSGRYVELEITLNNKENRSALFQPVINCSLNNDQEGPEMSSTFSFLVCILAFLIGILIGEKYRKWKKDRDERKDRDNKK